jgi:hypothetical protein
LIFRRPITFSEHQPSAAHQRQHLLDLAQVEPVRVQRDVHGKDRPQEPEPEKQLMATLEAEVPGILAWAV